MTDTHGDYSLPDLLQTADVCRTFHIQLKLESCVALYSKLALQDVRMHESVKDTKGGL